MITTAQRRARRRLNLPVQLGTARRPLSPDALGPVDRLRLQRFQTRSRKRDWLRGRAALRTVVADLEGLSFPHPELSLSHSADQSVAVAIPGCAGTGIDFEAPRAVDPQMARWYLNPGEYGSDLLRLWTVKEALFKACPENEGVVMTDFLLSDAEQRDGRARCRLRNRWRFRYCSQRFAGGWLSIAVAEEGPHGHL